MPVLRNILELLFPPRCPLCDRLLDVSAIRRKQKIHKACKKRLYPVSQPFCFHCGKPLEGREKEYCIDCRRRIAKTESVHWDGRPFSNIMQGRALYVYQGDIRQTMYRFKYSNRREYAAFFAEELCKTYGKWIMENQIEAVVPVPMYPKKKRQRGYNQAGILAKAVAGEMGLIFEPDAVRRLVDTSPQKKLNAKERKNNLKNAFQAEDFVVKYKCILLVDDIYTTGATAEAVAEALCQKGVNKIFLLSVCTGRGL